MFDTRLLPSFIAVAQYQHFGKAAAAVHATQPGVSQHIAKLEAQLTFKLVERTKRSVALTPAGEAFYQQAKKLMATMSHMREEGLQIAHGLLGQVGVGMASSVIYSDVPDRIARFKASNPKVHLRFIVQAGNFLKELIDSGDLDIVISQLPMSAPDYQSIEVARQQVGVALPKSNLLANRKYLTLAMLRDERFIVVPREYDPYSHDTLLSRMRSLGVTPQIAAYETPSLNAIARVAVGEGIALLPLGYRSEHHDSVHVVRLRDKELGSAKLYATTRLDRARPVVQRFTDAIAK